MSSDSHKKRFDSKEFRRTHKQVRSKEFSILGKVEHYLEEASSEEIQSNRAEVQALASYLLDCGRFPLEGALLYERLGKGKKAVPRVRNSLEAHEMLHLGFVTYSYKDVRDFLKKYSPESESGGFGIEGRVGIFLALTIGGLVVGINSLNVTGNVVGSVGTSQGAFGGLLFIAGVAGMFFLLKKK